MSMTGILGRAIAETPITVVDTETTGLYPGGDRIIEIAVVRAAPGEEPKVVLDTLVNPERPVSATEIHGITDQDVADAPTFRDIAGHVVEALRGSVFASYNVYFDSKFVREELRRAGVRTFPPHLCLMYMRPMLGMGRKCSLRDACADSGVKQSSAHHAAADALAAVALWKQYLAKCGKDGVRTFRELAGLRSYKFTSSFDDPMLDEDTALAPHRNVRMKSRGSANAHTSADPVPAQTDRQPVLSAYWDALSAALADLDVTPHEVFYLKAKQSALGMRPEELRWLHARAFSGLLADICQDKAVTNEEVQSLSGIMMALRELGWAPGDPLAGAVAVV